MNQGDKARFRLSISKDAGVYVEYDGKSKESGQHLGFQDFCTVFFFFNRFTTVFDLYYI